MKSAEKGRALELVYELAELLERASDDGIARVELPAHALAMARALRAAGDSWRQVAARLADRGGHACSAATVRRRVLELTGGVDPRVGGGTTP